MSKDAETVGLLTVNDHNKNNLTYNSFDQQQNQQIINLKSPANTSIPNIETFLRKTIKFWVLPSNFTAVKRKILRNINEYRVDGKKSQSLETSGSFVESIYFDTDSLSLYNKRILQVDESMLFRYRWYGNKKCKMGYFEQKLRKPEWRGEASKKQRFQIDPKTVQKFLKNGPNVVPQQNRPPFINQVHQFSANTFI